MSESKEKFVIWQAPNAALWIWIATWLAGAVIKSEPYATWIHFTGLLAILTWGSQELTTGVNWFRRLLGGVVLIAIVRGLFTS